MGRGCHRGPLTVMANWQQWWVQSTSDIGRAMLKVMLCDLGVGVMSSDAVDQPRGSMQDRLQLSDVAIGDELVPADKDLDLLQEFHCFTT